MSSSLYRQQLERWLKQINVDCDSCLDVGGGQLPIKDRVNSWQVREYKLLDNDAQYKPDYFCDLNAPIRLKKKFDVVFCLEVMEYVWEAVVAHQNLFGFLKDDGIAYVSYPTLYPLHNPPGIDYLRYTKNAVEKYLAVADFKTWEITPRMASDGLQSLSDFYSYERMRPIKGTKEIFHIGYMVKAFR